MSQSAGEQTLRKQARLAGGLFLGVNAIYIASLAASSVGPEEVRGAAVALQATASAATIAMAWAFYELLKGTSAGLALMALLFRVYLLLRSRIVPRAVAVLGLVATTVNFLDALIRMGAPTFAAFLAYSGVLLLFAETVTGAWLLFAPRRASAASA